MGAAIPSNSTCVPASIVGNLPSVPGAAAASAAGPMADPNSVTISPGDTPPAWYVAALATPPALIAGRAAPGAVNRKFGPKSQRKVGGVGVPKMFPAEKSFGWTRVLVCVS